MINGKIYKEATISRVEADGIVLRTKTGIYKIYFVELPKDIQDHFHYSPVTPIAAQLKRTPTKVEANRMTLGRTNESGWAGRFQLRLFS